jgi:hypothetical protein
MKQKVAEAGRAVDHDPCLALQAFITQARDQQTYRGVVWEASSWDITSTDVKTRAHLAHKKTLLFTERSIERVAIERRVVFETTFANLVKACVVNRRLKRGMESGTQRVFVRASRYLYETLPLPVRRDPTRITRGHFVAAETACQLREKPSSAYRVSQNLQEFARILDRHALCRGSIEFRSSVRRPENPADRTTAEFDQRVRDLPSPDVLDALAVVANDPELENDPFDLLRCRVAELLFVCGFRIGEALTLPRTTLVREAVVNEAQEARLDAITGVPLERLGLRYWPEKGGAPVVKWIPSVANPLLLRAIDDIERLCGPARQNAAWLEAHPGDVALDIDDGELLSLDRAAQIIGITSPRNVMQWFAKRRRGGIGAIVRRARRCYVTGAALRFALASDRYERPVLVRDDGQRQDLSESLLVMFMHELGEGRSTNRHISMPVTWQQINDFLCGRADHPSVFERRGYVDDAGRPFRIKTHDFRRLLNVVAQRGGLSQTEIAQWMGRRRVADNAAYDLRTAAEMAGQMRNLVAKNSVYGAIADQVRSLPEPDRDAFLEARLAMVHTTPLGDCASNIAEAPCATAVSCLGGCRHYLRRKGDESSRNRLVTIESETISALQRARQAAFQGKHNAENWVRSQEVVLRTVRAALAIDDDPSLNPGALQHVSPDGPLLGEPL